MVSPTTYLYHCIHLTVLQMWQDQESTGMTLDYETNKHQHHSAAHCIPVLVSPEQSLTSLLSLVENILFQSGSRQS
jgi:hypothetical protein